MHYSEKHVVLKENKILWNRTKAAIPLSTELLRGSQKQTQTSIRQVPTGKCSSLTAQVADGKRRDCENEELPTAGEDQVQYHLRNLKMHRSMGPMGP